jgi:hypothetical protein
MYFNPLRVLMPAALWLVMIGFGKAVYDVVAHPVRISNNTVVIFMTGMIIGAVALLADLIVKSRPD